MTVSIVHRKPLGRGGLIGLIIGLNIVMMVSTDMYLPALPHMGETFGVSAGIVNLTLVGFFAFFALGVLVFGPLSDVRGRKPFLVSGCALYIAASVACALSPSIWILITGRVLQAIGAGCLSTVSTAMIKDLFEGRDREFVLSLTQSISLIGPMTAPFLGSLALMVASWRAIFWLLALFALACLVPLFLLEEPLSRTARSPETIFGSLGRLLVVGRDRAFRDFLFVIMILTAPYAAYLALCSFVYIDRFKLSNAGYSAFFAANALISTVAPLIYLRMSRSLRPKLIVILCFLLSSLGGLLVLAVGDISPFVFFLSFAPFLLAEGIVRPLSMVILLDQQERDTGAAVSLINLVSSLVFSLGMAIGGLGWSSYIVGLGAITLACAVIAALGWVYMSASHARLKGFE